MRKVLAIASVFVMSMVRSKLFATLALILVALATGLPLIVKSDGTAVGWAKIAVYYNLGATTVVLSIVSLWAACGAIAREIDGKQIQMVICKPVNAFQVWFGKWMGLLFLNIVMLTIAGSITCLLLYSHLAKPGMSVNPGDNPFSEVLTGRRVILPRQPDVETEVQQRLKHLLAQTNLPPEMTVNDLGLEIRNRILAEKSVVPIGRSREWIIDMPRYRTVPCPDAQPPDGPVVPAVALKFSFGSAYRDAPAIKCAWTIVSADGEKLVETAMTTHMEGETIVPLPAKLLAAKGPLTVVFRNDERGNSSTVVFDTRRGVALLVRESSFGSNLFRGLVIIFCQLAMLSALGLAVSSMFSLPVASFVAVTFVLMGLASHYLAGTGAPGAPRYDHEGNRIEQSLTDRIGEHLGSCIEVLVTPVTKTDPVALMSDGMLVTWKMTGEATLFLLVLYPVAMGIVGGIVLRRRQLALPER